jgi:hypothetical protein
MYGYSESIWCDMIPVCYTSRGEVSACSQCKPTERGGKGLENALAGSFFVHRYLIYLTYDLTPRYYNTSYLYMHAIPFMIDRDATGICKKKAEENGMKEEVYGSFTSFRPRARGCKAGEASVGVLVVRW